MRRKHGPSQKLCQNAGRSRQNDSRIADWRPRDPLRSIREVLGTLWVGRIAPEHRLWKSSPISFLSVNQLRWLVPVFLGLHEWRVDILGIGFLGPHVKRFNR